MNHGYFMTHLLVISFLQVRRAVLESLMGRSLPTPGLIPRCPAGFVQFGIVDADGGLSLWQTNTSGSTPKPYLVRAPRICLWVPVTVTAADLLCFALFARCFFFCLCVFCFLLADAAVPQQDGSRLCLCWLVLPHRHRGALD